MKKLFLSICFSLLCWQANDVWAKATAFDSLEQAQSFQESKTPFTPEVEDDTPDPTDQQAMDNFILDRLKKVAITQLDPKSDPNKSSSINMQHSDEYIAMMKEKNKSFLEKVYDAAINRISSESPTERADVQDSQTQFYELKEEQQEEFQAPDFPVVNLELPNQAQVLVPAREHIPYLSSQIEILPSGLVSFNDEIMVVATGQKLKNGLSRIVPKFSTSRDGTTNRINLNLVSVSINGQEIPHKIIEQADEYVIVPQDNYTLEPGIYTYNFQYLVDRQIWQYDDFNEFYWDITGGRWNLIVSRAFVSVSFPGKEKPISSLVFLGYPGALTSQGTAFAEGENSIGFASLVPLYIGEGMHILISFPKESFIAPDMNTKLNWFLGDFGDIIISTLALLTLLISYLLSWKSISQNKVKTNNYFKKGAPLLRLLYNGVFDKISFGAFLLEMYRKNIIDIQKSDDTILLVKKTDNLSSLEKVEKKAINSLFSKNDAILALNSTNQLKIKRAFALIEKATQKKLKKLSLKLNAGYLFFGVAMLVFAELAIALLNINFLQALFVLLSSSIMVAFYLWMSKRKCKSKITRWALKILCWGVILGTIIVMSAYIHLISAVFIFGAIYAIFAYCAIFAKRSGLIKSNIQDVMNFREYLLRNKDSICLGRDFLNQQANIFALDLAADFVANKNIQEYYKLDIMAEAFAKKRKGA